MLVPALIQDSVMVTYVMVTYVMVTYVMVTYVMVAYVSLKMLRCCFPCYYCSIFPPIHTVRILHINTGILVSILHINIGVVVSGLARELLNMGLT